MLLKLKNNSIMLVLRLLLEMTLITLHSPPYSHVVRASEGCFQDPSWVPELMDTHVLYIK